MTANLAPIPGPDRIDGELALVQANLTILSNLLGYSPERIERFVFLMAVRDMERHEGLAPAVATIELEQRIARAKNRTHALLNEFSFEGIREIDARLQAQVVMELARRDA